MGYLLLSQGGNTKRIEMPDAMIQAMDHVIIENFKNGRGVALDGIRLNEAKNKGDSGDSVTTMWLSPAAGLTLEYVRDTDNEKTDNHVRNMHQSIESSGRITIR